MQLLASEEYGLRCLLQVASSTDASPVSIAGIAHSEGLSPEYTAKLMRMLRLGGIVESVRGAEGGYRLTRPAAQITVWSALQPLGGKLFSEDFCGCHAGQRQRCVRDDNCAIRVLWGTLQSGARETLEEISLEDLLRDERAMATRLEGAPAGGRGPADRQEKS